jgi:hypothetical protein
MVFSLLQDYLDRFVLNLAKGRNSKEKNESENKKRHEVPLLRRLKDCQPHTLPL